MVSVILCITYRKSFSSKYFFYFILLSGVTSVIAAFGHLEILAITWQKGLLLFSRLVNMVSIFCFATGALNHFNYTEKRWVRVANPGLIAVSVMWLIYTNVYTPVMLYGIIGMIGIGLLVFLLNFSLDKESHTPIVLGVAILACSALFFATYKHSSFDLFNYERVFIASDISHILIATSLVVMTLGLKKLKVKEVKQL